MFHYKELIENPEKYKPLGSVKSAFNKEHNNTFTNVDIKSLFLSEPNIKMISCKIYKKNRHDGGRSDYYKILELTRYLLPSFLNKYNIYEFESVEDVSTGNINWAGILRVINNLFTKYVMLYFKGNNFVPTREWAEVGAYGERKQKKFNELTAEDMNTLDLWQEQEVQVFNGSYRNNNEIPFWQKTMHNRHYDRSNDGLTHINSDRSSLDNFIHHSYDMSNL